MKYLLLIIVLLTFHSCENETPVISDCQELIGMRKADEEMRISDSDEPWEPSDKKRRLRVLELLVSGKIKTHQDKMNAALILDHTGLYFCNDEMKSVSPENYYLAYLLAKSSLENGNNEAAYFTAVTYDRYQLFTTGIQKFGTQKVFKDGKEFLAPIDSSTTDEERSRYCIPLLKELLKQNEILSAMK